VVRGGGGRVLSERPTAEDNGILHDDHRHRTGCLHLDTQKLDTICVA
jgi:hypothetical protein